ncbi:hypothetical protein CBF60_03045 [Lactobacillus taiwanensis]|uniref:DUF7010 family protein n=1 Tax=Lactobacillus taiwanensis TaxID=508451 RepID=UPI000B98B2AF|nr:hypothetical protein [Lactobacillus taiwanensis]OYS19610.1 hypothetical protein CBF76_04985 [Lactobacillus taiwanensis]OYS24012.1 hypothetical protein CBF55_04720 [Lactobacillus taiwanensis]OYS24493.1 hypothetical protein CBF73_05970 [Lactobacillus taiwanensis]OYS25193.1 hypothetical protein CBF66_02710 [Lactobacillus taiwanensis]OYS29086.1 hypothetical protein CBF60_03045 [Lactobacillus taiwanensis]
MNNLDALRNDCIIKQKRGLHFIFTSVIIWIGILLVNLSSMPLLTKNLFTFMCTALLLPIAFLMSKLLKIDFQNKDNPLTVLGVLLSSNQILYLLIAMWIYSAIPNKMVMVIAIIFGAHLLPYSWLYKSKSYLIFSIVISFLALFIGLTSSSVVLASLMIIIELVFGFTLVLENKREIEDSLND